MTKYAIFNKDNTFKTIKESKDESLLSIELDETTHNRIRSALTRKFDIFYDEDSGVIKTKMTIDQLKELLRRKRDDHLRKSDVLALNDFWSGWTDDEKTAITNYRQELRDYINNINTVEDVGKVEYPTAPKFAEKYI